MLTGDRQIGKTTLLAELFPEPVPGITTWAQPGEAAYLKDNESNTIVQIGRFDPSLPGSSNKMVLCSDGFSAVGIPALRRCSNNPDHPWVTIDEIGYLESGSEAYQNAVRDLLDCKHVAMVVRKQNLPFLQELWERADVFRIDLDAPFGNLGCVIMASGLGKRFGKNKLLEDFRGKPMILHALEATSGIFAKRVVVTRHEDVAALCQARGVSAVLHDLPHRSDTVRLGLEAVGQVEGCAFCPGDQPMLRRDTVAALALAAWNDHSAIWRAAFEAVEGSPVFFPSWTFPELMDLPEGKGGGVVIKKYPECLRKVSTRDKYELWDIDYPEDLESLVGQ